MPARDGTGPWGRGPMTGRGMGPCGWGAARGFGRGFGRGYGWGFGRGFGYAPRFTKEEEIKILEEEKDALEEELKALSDRIKELKNAKA